MKPISMSRLSGLTAQVIYITQLYLTLRTVTVGSEVDSEAGGYGVVFGSELSKEKLEELRQLIVKYPRRWIAQEVVDFKDLEILEDDKLVWRKADLRAFVVTGKDTKVWKAMSLPVF